MLGKSVTNNLLFQIMHCNPITNCNPLNCKVWYENYHKIAQCGDYTHTYFLSVNYTFPNSAFFRVCNGYVIDRNHGRRTIRQLKQKCILVHSHNETQDRHLASRSFVALSGDLLARFSALRSAPECDHRGHPYSKDNITAHVSRSRLFA